MKGNNMKKLMIAAAGALAIGMSAVADATPTAWFNGGIDKDWPDNAVGGTWTVPEGATATIEDDALAITASVTNPVTFTATAPKAFGKSEADKVFVDSTVTFTPFPEDELPQVPEGAKAGIIAVKESKGTYWYILVQDENGGSSNVWKRADVEVTNLTAAVKITLRGEPIEEGEAFAPNADYSIDGDDVDGGIIYVKGDQNVQTTCYAGDGSVKSLSATYEAEAPTTVLLTISAENATVDGISAGEVSVGETLNFTVTADPGYSVTNVTANGTTLTPEAGTYTYTVGNENVAIVVLTKQDVTPVAPGEYKDTAETAVEAAAKVTVINADKASYIKAPSGAETTETYLALFEAKATENATTGGYDITVELTPAAEELLQAAADDQVAAALDDSAIETIPGLYYTYVGGTEVTGITTSGTKTLATTTETTVPKPELGTTDKAFYQLKIEVK